MKTKSLLSLFLCILIATAFMPTVTKTNAAAEPTIISIDSGFISNNGNASVHTVEAPVVNTYSVSFDLSSATESTALDTLYAAPGQSVALPDCTATKTGYDFIGWSSTADSTDAKYLAGSSMTVSGDIVLYPVWLGRLKTYKVYHYYQDNYAPGYKLYKTDYLEARVGETTTAEAITMLGCNMRPFSQKTVMASGTTFVSIYYTKGDIVASDVNADGTIDMLDAVYLQRCLANFEGYDTSKICVYAADCNIDGSVGAADVLTLLSQLAGNNPPVGNPKDEDNWGDWV